MKHGEIYINGYGDSIEAMACTTGVEYVATLTDERTGDVRERATFKAYKSAKNWIEAERLKTDTAKDWKIYEP